MNQQNQFEQSEEQAARMALLFAQTHATYYAQPQDREAATIALLLRALELAGGKDFINHRSELE
jgi:hypothetical protein